MVSAEKVTAEGTVEKLKQAVVYVHAHRVVPE